MPIVRAGISQPLSLDTICGTYMLIAQRLDFVDPQLLRRFDQILSPQHQRLQIGHEPPVVDPGQIAGRHSRSPDAKTDRPEQRPVAVALDHLSVLQNRSSKASQTVSSVASGAARSKNFSPSRNV